MKKLSYLLMIIGMLCASCSKEELTETGTVEIHFSVLEENHSEFAMALWEAVNAYRREKGLNELYLDDNAATSLAIQHSMHMRTDGRISHYGFVDRTRALKNAGAESVGENVAFGYQRASDVVVAWSNSPAHKIVLEGNYTHCGIGVVADDGGRQYMTQLFYR
ncbi:CAP domain-containing protein [Aureisphaera galaxeae]|uniref:CAP domain-containing protein n=1 Tax=Aureisphaera galaxeae TaxID=1538023 RepID=UPI0023502878|nr:CAP domain-containing protein [Aureisphaera galaxeae]MDC8005826.1 CAP domain-containing protein [Aureisphaera galaxeae]